MHQRRNRSIPDSGRTPSRRGAVLVLALVCVALIVAILASLITISRNQHKQKVRDELALQADWMAESAFERAVAMLDADAEYAGEEWFIPSPTAGDERSGLALIAVEPIEGRPDERIVTVSATFPTDAEVFVKRSKQQTVRRNAAPQE